MKVQKKHSNILCASRDGTKYAVGSSKTNQIQTIPLIRAIFISGTHTSIQAFSIKG
jgi:hypothetical protein